MSSAPSMRIRVKCASALQGRWMLVPSSAAVVGDVLNAVSSSLSLSRETAQSAELLLHGSPLLLNEHIAVIRDGDTLELRTCDAGNKAEALNAEGPRTPVTKLSTGRKSTAKLSAAKRSRGLLFKFSTLPRPAGPGQPVQQVSKPGIVSSAGKEQRARTPSSSGTTRPAMASPTGKNVPKVERRLKFAAPSGETTEANPRREHVQQRRNYAQTRQPPPDTTPPSIPVETPRPASKPAPPAVDHTSGMLDLGSAAHVKRGNGEPGDMQAATMRPKTPPDIMRKPRRADEPPLCDSTTTESKKRRRASQPRQIAGPSRGNASNGTMSQGITPSCATPQSNVFDMKSPKSSPAEAGLDRERVRRRKPQSIAAGSLGADTGIEENRRRPPHNATRPTNASSSDAPDSIRSSETMLPVMNTNIHTAKILSGRGIEVSMRSDEPPWPQEDSMVLTPGKSAASTREKRMKKSLHQMKAPPERRVPLAMPLSNPSGRQRPHTVTKPAVNVRQLPESHTTPADSKGEQHARLGPSSDRPITDQGRRIPSTKESLRTTQLHCGLHEKAVHATEEKQKSIDARDNRDKAEDSVTAKRPLQASAAALVGRGKISPFQDISSPLDRSVRVDLPRVEISVQDDEIIPSGHHMPSIASTDHTCPATVEVAFPSPFAITPQRDVPVGNYRLTGASGEVGNICEPDGRYMDRKDTQQTILFEEAPIQFVPPSHDSKSVDASHGMKAHSYAASRVKQSIIIPTTSEGDKAIRCVQAGNDICEEGIRDKPEARERTAAARIVEPAALENADVSKDQVPAQVDMRLEDVAANALTRQKPTQSERDFQVVREARLAHTAGKTSVRIGEKCSIRNATPTVEPEQKSGTRNQQCHSLAPPKSTDASAPLGVGVVALKTRKKRNRCLSVEGKRKRNARNRRREQRKRQGARERSVGSDLMDGGMSHGAANNRDAQTGAPGEVPSTPTGKALKDDCRLLQNRAKEKKSEIETEVAELSQTVRSRRHLQNVATVADMKGNLSAMKLKVINELNRPIDGNGSIQQGLTSLSRGNLEATTLPEELAKIPALPVDPSENRSCKKPSRLRQGSVAAALRIARSHGVLDSGKNEQKRTVEPNKPSVSQAKSHGKGKSKVLTKEVSDAGAEVSQQPPAKKRKLSKRARLYIDEEQYNESFFVGFECSGGIPLPSPDLLNLFDIPMDTAMDEELNMPEGILRKEGVVQNENASLKLEEDRRGAPVEGGNPIVSAQPGLHVADKSSGLESGREKTVPSKQPQTLDCEEKKKALRAKLRPSATVPREEIRNTITSNDSQDRVLEVARGGPFIPREQKTTESGDKGAKSASGLTDQRSVTPKGTAVKELDVSSPHQGESSGAHVKTQHKPSSPPGPQKAKRRDGSQVNLRQSRHLRLSGTYPLIQRPPPVSVKEEWKSEYLTTPAGKVLNTSPFSDRCEAGQPTTREDRVSLQGSGLNRGANAGCRITKEEKPWLPDSKPMTSHPEGTYTQNGAQQQSHREASAESPGRIPEVFTKGKTGKAASNGPTAEIRVDTEGARPRNPNLDSRTESRVSYIRSCVDRQNPPSSDGLRPQNIAVAGEEVAQVRGLPDTNRSTVDSYRTNLVQALTDSTNAVSRFCKGRYSK